MDTTAPRPSAPGSLPARTTCPRCGRGTSQPEDISAGYCGSCHEWTRPPLPADLGARRVRSILNNTVLATLYGQADRRKAPTGGRVPEADLVPQGLRGPRTEQVVQFLTETLWQMVCDAAAGGEVVEYEHLRELLEHGETAGVVDADETARHLLAAVRGARSPEVTTWGPRAPRPSAVLPGPLRGLRGVWRPHREIGRLYVLQELVETPHPVWGPRFPAGRDGRGVPWELLVLMDGPVSTMVSVSG